MVLWGRSEQCCEEGVSSVVGRSEQCCEEGVSRGVSGVVRKE